MRLRAERRCGELLKELERATPTDAGKASGAARSNVSAGVTRSPYAQALDEAGLSRQRANRMEALANVPADDFESALGAPEKPTVTGILERAIGQGSRFTILAGNWAALV